MTGNLVIKPVFRSVNLFSGGVAAVNISEDMLHGNWGFIDKKGNFTFNPMFDRIEADHDGVLNVIQKAIFYLFQAYKMTTKKLLISTLFILFLSFFKKLFHDVMAFDK